MRFEKKIVLLGSLFYSSQHTSFSNMETPGLTVAQGSLEPANSSDPWLLCLRALGLQTGATTPGILLSFLSTLFLKPILSKCWDLPSIFLVLFSIFLSSVLLHICIPRLYFLIFLIANKSTFLKNGIIIFVYQITIEYTTFGMTVSGQV